MAKRDIQIEIGSGELIDKITILQIKSERMRDAGQLKNIRYELAMLERIRDAALPPSDELARYTQELKTINESLWEIEDAIRACEVAKDFGARFIELARAVYITNDKRAGVKKQINLLTGAQIVEEKSYTKFD